MTSRKVFKNDVIETNSHTSSRNNKLLQMFWCGNWGFLQVCRRGDRRIRTGALTWQQEITSDLIWQQRLQQMPWSGNRRLILVFDVVKGDYYNCLDGVTGDYYWCRRCNRILLQMLRSGNGIFTGVLAIIKGDLPLQQEIITGVLVWQQGMRTRVLAWYSNKWFLPWTLMSIHS